MWPVFQALFAVICTAARSRLSLQLEVVALRHQLNVYQRSVKRPRIQPGDRIIWCWLSRHWSRWRSALQFVQPLTVIAWQRRRFREHWARLSRHGSLGRPAVNKEIQDLIRRLSRADPDWGSPRIVGELGKLGIEVAKSTVEKYRIRSSKPPSPTWRGVPEQPRRRSCIDRLLYNSDAQLQGAVRPDRALALPTQGHSFQRY